MAVDQRLIDWVEEAVAPLGPLSWRRMMGGATLYCDGTVFAIIADDQLWLKSDTESDAAWDAAGAERFTYMMRDGRRETMNYRRAPDDCYDDAELLRDWARLAIAAGARAPRRTKRRT